MKAIRNSKMNLAEFLTFIARADRLVVIDFMAVWAPPCKVMNDRMEKLTERVKDYCIVKRICVNDFPDVHNHFKIHDLPTFIFFKRGEEI